MGEGAHADTSLKHMKTPVTTTSLHAIMRPNTSETVPASESSAWVRRPAMEMDHIQASSVGWNRYRHSHALLRSMHSRLELAASLTEHQRKVDWEHDAKERKEDERAVPG